MCEILTLEKQIEAISIEHNDIAEAKQAATIPKRGNNTIFRETLNTPPHIEMAEFIFVFSRAVTIVPYNIVIDEATTPINIIGT